MGWAPPKRLLFAAEKRSGGRRALLRALVAALVLLSAMPAVMLWSCHGVGRERCGKAVHVRMAAAPAPAPAVSSLIFIKTYKTGSTTMGSMLFRAGMRRNLTFVADDAKRHYITVNTTACPTCNITLFHDFSHRMHGPEYYQRFVPAGGPFVTIVRQPVSRYLSDFYYHVLPDIGPNFTVSEVLTALPRCINKTFPMAQTLGLDDATVAAAANANGSGAAAHAALSAAVEAKAAQFRVMLVLERLDESLVLMKRLFRWSLADILYLTVNEGCGNPRPWDKKMVRCPVKLHQLEPPLVQELERALVADAMIYRAATRQLNILLAQQDSKGFAADLAAFVEMNARLRAQCTGSDAGGGGNSTGTAVGALPHRHACCYLYELRDFPPPGYEEITTQCASPRRSPDSAAKCAAVRECMRLDWLVGSVSAGGTRRHLRAALSS